MRFTKVLNQLSNSAGIAIGLRDARFTMVLKLEYSFLIESTRLGVVLFTRGLKLSGSVPEAMPGLRVVLFTRVLKLQFSRRTSGVMFESCVVYDGSQTSA